jgi:hypothetical protein
MPVGAPARNRSLKAVATAFDDHETISSVGKMWAKAEFEAGEKASVNEKNPG